MLLSIIIPSYNHERFVINTMEASAKIDVQDKEIIVIDDGSSDTSASLIREYITRNVSGNNPRLIQRTNRGLVKTLNEGLSIALGKYFYVVASDDIPIPAGVSSLVNHLEKDGNLQFALGNALIMNSEYQGRFRPAYGEAHRRFLTLPYDRRRKEMFLHYPQPLLLQATVFRTSALRTIGGWREELISDDLSLFLRLFSEPQSVGMNFAYYPDVFTCFYRRHEANISNNLQRQFMTSVQALKQLCPPEWQDAAYLRTVADLGITALKSGEIDLVAGWFNSTVAHIGLLRSLRAAGPALIDSLLTRLSRRLSPRMVVTHEPAASVISRSHEQLPFSQEGTSP
jgi:glycosyltransferase involved in cell wall biosynthesis